MKKTRLLIIAIIAICLVACKGRNEPTAPSTGGKTTVSFSYEKQPPFTFYFTNTSKNVTSYRWDFGDGSISSEKDPVHTYASTGTYIVTLTGTDSNGAKYDARANITINEPKIYIAGYTLYSIPYENRYYKVVCEDDDWLTTNWGFTTVYTPLLDRTDMPYSRMFNSPLLMDKLSGDNYYTFYVYHATQTNNTSTDVQCMKQKLTKNEIMKYKQEHILTSDNGQTRIGIIMDYR